MVTLTTFFIAALAAHRLSVALAEEEGPFSLFVKLRGRLDPDQKTWLGRGINCVFCVSFWMALPIALLVAVLGYADMWAWPLIWLGLAGAVMLIRRWEQKK